MPVLGSPPSGLTLLFHKAVSNAHVHTLTAQLEPFIDRLLFIYFLVGRGGGLGNKTVLGYMPSPRHLSAH